MKAKLIRLSCGILIAALLAASAGCGGKTDNGQTTATIPDETAVTQAAETGGTTAANETEPTTQDAVETTQTNSAADAEATKEASGEWAAAYREHLLKFIADMEDYDLRDEFRFGLFYLNDDDVPELWYMDGIGAHGPSYQIVTCRGGKAVSFTNGDDYFANDVGYYEKQGVFDASGSAGGMVGTGRTYYQMTDSGYETLAELTAYYKYEDEDMMGEMVLDQNGDPIVVYRINGKEVTEAEYDAFQKDCDTRYGKWRSFEDDPSFPLNKDSVMKNCK